MEGESMSNHNRLSGSERRRQILEIAIRLFAEKGFGGTRTKDIAHAAQISETLIFQHFDTKEDLYLAALAEVFGHHPVKPEIEEISSQRDDYGVFSTVARHIQKHLGNPIVARLMLFAALEGPQLTQSLKPRDDLRHQTITDVLSDYIQERINEGVFHNIDAHTSAHLFVTTVSIQTIYRIIPFLETPHDAILEDSIDTLVKIFLNAFKKG
jgi:TetR/AcrR family transcriptional regulator